MIYVIYMLAYIQSIDKYLNESNMSTTVLQYVK